MLLSRSLAWDLMNPILASAVNPLLANLLVQGKQLQNIMLINGTTSFNHGLGRTPIGWILSDQNAAANIYRSQPFNPQTLTLTASAAVTVSLWVF